MKLEEGLMLSEMSQHIKWSHGEAATSCSRAELEPVDLD